MKSKNYKLFMERSSKLVHDEEHTAKLSRAISTYSKAVSAAKTKEFHSWGQAREVLGGIKAYALSRLPELLEEFEEKAAANGITVLWAEDSDQAVGYVLQAAKERQAKILVKAKSMTTEELELNSALEKRGIKVWESDLGELIVQLAGEKPYHIVTPAMHKTRREIGELFHKVLGIPLTEDAEELTAAARKHLRHTFTEAQIGMTGANFLVASEGAVVVTENEGNARLSTSCPPLHIVIAGIEKIIPSIHDLEIFLPMLATSGTGQQLTCYNTIIRGPRREREADGPEEMIVILLDNGRSTVFQDEENRESLRCIRCGACLNVCPVYRGVGGHTYQTTYQGPIGSVITPQLRGIGAWHHLSSASSLCGACTEACPTAVPLHHLLLKNRHSAYLEHEVSPLWKYGLLIWSRAVTSRALLDNLRPLSRMGLSLARKLLPKPLVKRIPNLPQKSFSMLWKEHERERKNS